MNKIIKIIMDIVLVIIIILLVLYFYYRTTGQSAIFKVQTGSMEEGIHVGDYILIKKAKNYKVGDIVTYQENGSYITHRIVKTNGNKVVTKGDANNTIDDEISIDKIAGKVIIAGGILNFVMNFRYALISLFLTIYLFTCYFSGKKEK